MTQNELDRIGTELTACKLALSNKQKEYDEALNAFSSINCPLNVGDKVEFKHYRTLEQGIFLGIKPNTTKPIIAKIKKDGTASANHHTSWVIPEHYSELTKID